MWARLKDGSDLDGKRLAALVALANANAGRLALHQSEARLIRVAAMRADRAVRPNARLDVLVSGLLVVKVAI